MRRFARKQVLALMAVAFFAGTGCATKKGNIRPDRASNPNSINDILNEDPADPEKTGVITVKDGDIIFRGTKLKNTKFDFPITINSRVEYWVDYFCGKGRKYYERYLERSEFFIPYIEPILKSNNMPRDLVYLSMIESGFNNLAKSHAKAVGPWQFMPFTGRRYGLSVNWWVDERRDIRKSTLAAIEYLRDLYNMFGSWELAAASYNAGEAKVARAIQRYGTTDFWSLTRHRFLRPETRDYVPKLIAAAIIDKNREQFGFKLPKHVPAPDEAIAPSGEIVKLVKTEKPERDALTTEMAEDVAASDDENAANSADEDDEREEEEVDGEAQLASSETDASPKAKPVPTPHLTKDGEIRGEELVEFEVESPGDLLQIAAAAGLSYQTVKSLNPELLRWCTPPTKKTYRIKLPASTKERFLLAYNDPGFQKQVQFMVYQARNGDTLARIAARFGIKVDPVAELNRMPAKARLRKGVKVLLPLPNDRSRSLASLEVKDPPEKSRKRKGGRRRSRKISLNTPDSGPRISANQRKSARSRGDF